MGGRLKRVLRACLNFVLCWPTTGYSFMDQELMPAFSVMARTSQNKRTDDRNM